MKTNREASEAKSSHDNLTAAKTLSVQRWPVILSQLRRIVKYHFIVFFLLFCMHKVKVIIIKSKRDQWSLFLRSKIWIARQCIWLMVLHSHDYIYFKRLHFSVCLCITSLIKSVCLSVWLTISVYALFLMIKPAHTWNWLPESNERPQEKCGEKAKQTKATR